MVNFELNNNVVVFVEPLAAFSVQGPFITFRMLQASVYSSSGSNFGVSKKHLQETFSQKWHIYWQQTIVQEYGVVLFLLRCIWLTGCPDKLLKHFPFIYRIHSCVSRFEQCVIMAYEGKIYQVRQQHTLIDLINHTERAISEILNRYEIKNGWNWALLGENN